MALLDFTSSPHGGRLRLLPENQTEPAIVPRVLIYHSIVGSAEGAYLMFRDRSNLESHFIVAQDGEIWQLVDTTRQADANLDANAFAISVETEDRGDPDSQPWTDAQLDSLAWIAWRINRLHAVPLRRCPAWDSAGIGYHTLFGSPSHWTPVAKSCPGRVRIRQFDEVLLPRIVAGEEADMALSDEQARQLEAIYKGLIVPGTTTPDQTVDLLFARVRTIEAAVQPTADELVQLRAKVDALKAAVDGLALGRLEGDLDVTGLLHFEAAPPPPVADVELP
jgi:hypothetical protein